MSFAVGQKVWIQEAGTGLCPSRHMRGRIAVVLNHNPKRQQYRVAVTVYRPTLDSTESDIPTPG